MVDKKKRNVAHLEAAMLICVQKIARYSHVIKIDQLRPITDKKSS